MNDAIFAFFLLVLPFTACKESDPLPLEDCNAELCTAILDSNEAKVGLLVNDLAADLMPEPVAGDDLGHAQNLDILVERLNGCKCLQAVLVCYACIETLPLQSEIRVKATVGDVSREVVFDIFTPEGEVLRFAGLHE